MVNQPHLSQLHLLSALFTVVVTPIVINHRRIIGSQHEVAVHFELNITRFGITIRREYFATENIQG